MKMSVVLTSPCDISSSSHGPQFQGPKLQVLLPGSPPCPPLLHLPLMEGNMEEQREVLGANSQEAFGNLSQNSFSDFWAAV